MPFTVNVGAYQGGQMLAQAGQNLGQGILGGVVNYMEGQKDLANDQVLLDFYSKQGMVTPDILDKYQRGSHSGKTGIIAGLTRQFAEQQQQAQEQRLTDAQAEMARYHQASLANEATRIGIQQAQEAREKAAANFTPRPPMQFATPPPDQTGIPYGPPTEAEAAAPKVTMIEKSPGKWEQPDASGGGAFTPGPPQEVRNPTTGEVEGFTVPTSKGGQQFVNTRTGTITDQNGNVIAYTHGRSVIKPTAGKEWTPVQVEHAFSNFNVKASDVSNTKGHHALDIHGNDTDNPDEVVSYRVETDHGNQYIPKDSFEGLKEAISGEDSLFNRHKRATQTTSQAAPKAAPSPVTNQKQQQAVDYLKKIGKPVTPANIQFYIDHA